MSLSRAAAIVGLGATAYTRYSGRGGTSLATEAITRALEDAGLRPADVDGMAHYVTDTSTSVAELVTTLGIPNLSFTSAAGWGGAAGPAIVAHAASAIVAGMADTVVCYRAQPNTPEGGIAPGSAGPPGRNRVLGGEFLAPFGFGNEHNVNALHMRRHIALYGTKEEHLGAIAVTLRHNASLNPQALIREPITLDDYLASPYTIEPLRAMDIGGAAHIDGAAAVVLTSADRARVLQKPPVFVLGAGQATGPAPIAYYGPPDLSVSHHAYVAPRLFERAGLSPADVSVAELYDPNTVQVLLQLEDYEFCPKGEGGPFAASSAIGHGGRIPITTHGGSLAEGYLQSFGNIVEAVRQLRNEAGARQVRDAAVALATGSDRTGASAVLLGT